MTALDSGRPRPLLVCDDVWKSYGGVTAVAGVSFALWPGQVLALIGPNGSGKTTLLNCLAGELLADRGRIMLGDWNATRAAVEARAGRGLARTFQTLRLFNSLSVRDNLRIGGHRIPTAGRLWPRSRERQIRERADEMIAALGLELHARRPVGVLPYGVQRRVEIARALMSRPSCVLLDEPAAGMNEVEAASLRQTLQDFSAGGIALVVVEHNTHFIAGLAHRAVVLDGGETVADGTVDSVLRDTRVVEAYFG